MTIKCLLLFEADGYAFELPGPEVVEPADEGEDQRNNESIDDGEQQRGQYLLPPHGDPDVGVGHDKKADQRDDESDDHENPHGVNEDRSGRYRLNFIVHLNLLKYA